MSTLMCWLMHRKDRTILVDGVLPWGLDAVVFCYRCDRMRGRAVQVLQPTFARSAF